MISILLPTDFSDNSWNAIKYTLQLYQKEQCTFHLFHAYTPIIYNIEYMLMAPAQFGLEDPTKATCEQHLKKLVQRISDELGDNPNHSFKTTARFDTLVMGVEDVIEESDVDLIAMGTQGATGAKGVLFGSNTVQIFKSVKCPILAIPSEFEYDPLQEILLPTDLEINYDNVNFDMLKTLAISHNARVNVLHISFDTKLSDEKTKNYQQLQSLLEDTAHLFFGYSSKDIPKGINEFQTKHKINLLAMVNNKHSFFENLFFKNTVHQIGLHLNIPFLVIPTKKTK